MYVHDRSKMKCDIDNCDDINVTGNENLVRDKVEIKQEFENFSSDDKTGIQNIIEDKADVEHLAENIKVEMISIDSQGDADITYDNFKCKNEEIELKLESEDGDGQSTDRYEKVNVKEITSSGGPNKNSFNNKEEEWGCSNIRDFKCIFCSKEFVRKSYLDYHLLRIHKCRDGVTSKIHNCDKCSYITTKKSHMMRHGIKHGIKEGLEKYKCQYCIYETYVKSSLITHIKTHNNTRDFECTLCSKHFTAKVPLDNHLLMVHKSRNNVTSKIHECDKCSYSTTRKSTLLKHKLKHGITVELEKYKCQICIYETYDKSNIIKHMKTHNNTRDFKCTLCLKHFTAKIPLEDHLLIVHKDRDNVTSKIHDCDQCSYASTKKINLLRHKLKHGITVGLEKYKCQNCVYETYDKSNLMKHMKIHNIQDFKCTLCSRSFTGREFLDTHVLEVHKSENNVTSKIHECDVCSYETTYKSNLLRHKLKHGITEGLEKYKCQHCIYETYSRSHLIRHVKTHNNIRDFKCILCLKDFTQRKYLDDHLLKLHKRKDFTSKIHECDVCKYATTIHYQLLKHKLTHNNILDFKCNFCSEKFTRRISLDTHLLKVHKNKNSIGSKIHECDRCSYSAIRHTSLLKHKLKHGITVGFDKYKCHNCIYETYDKSNLIKHMKTHYNIRDFKCTLCSESFIQRESLDDHLLKVHKSRDNITSKIHECEECNYETTIKCNLLKHKLKHGITIGLEKYKCQVCIYETYNKSHLIRHLKIHNIEYLKCTLCSKKFTHRVSLDNHLLKVHKNKDSVSSKIHECTKCNYSTTKKCNLLEHNLKHGVTEGLEKYKCQCCIYETYKKSNLIRHIKTHNNIKDFKCTLCSKHFSAKKHLDDHFLIVHKSRDNVTSKIHECDKCSYETTIKSNLLKHKLKHCATVEIEKN